MSENKRKEVLLDKETLSILEAKAKKQGRNLKNYMEFILREEAYAFEPSASYKLMMDKMIDNPEIINQIFELEKINNRSFEEEIKNAITAHKLKEETDAYIKSLNWAK